MKTTKSDLTAARLRELLHYDPETGVFTRKVRTAQMMRVGDIAGNPHENGYITVQLLGRTYRAHVLAWLYTHSAWPPEDVDHINRVRHDNRISNLRLASRSENLQNSGLSRRNTSRHKGVRRQVLSGEPTGRWQAFIYLHRRFTHLGIFSSVEDAAAARKAAEALYHPFAVKEAAHA